MFYGYTTNKNYNFKLPNNFKNSYKNNNICIYNYNLKITDLQNNNYILCYDGFISNKSKLIKILNDNNYFIKSNTDEEIILLLYIIFKEKILNYLEGVFSIVIYEELENKLFFAKDKSNIYSIFYTFHNSNIVFSNSVKSIIDIINIPPTINKNGLLKLLTFNTINNDYRTIFKDILDINPKYYFLFKEGTFIKKIYKTNNAYNNNNINDLLNKKCCILSNTICNDNAITYSINYIKKYKNSSIIIKDNKNTINILLDNIYFFDITNDIIKNTAFPNILDYYKTFYTFLDLIKNDDYDLLITDEIFNLYNNTFNNDFKISNFNFYNLCNKNIILKNDLKIYINKFNNKYFQKYILNYMFKYALILSANFNISTYNITNFNNPLLKYYKNYSKEYIILLENKLKEFITNKNNKIFKIFDINYIKSTLNFHGENLESTFFSYQELLSYIIQIDYLINNFNVNLDF